MVLGLKGLGVYGLTYGFGGLGLRFFSVLLFGAFSASGST